MLATFLLVWSQTWIKWCFFSHYWQSDIFFWNKVPWRIWKGEKIHWLRSITQDVVQYIQWSGITQSLKAAPVETEMWCRNWLILTNPLLIGPGLGLDPEPSASIVTMGWMKKNSRTTRKEAFWSFCNNMDDVTGHDHVELQKDHCIWNELNWFTQSQEQHFTADHH